MKKLVCHHLDSIYDMFRCVMKKQVIPSVLVYFIPTAFLDFG